MNVIAMQDVDLNDNIVLLREDFNVPLDDSGNITSDTRIKAGLPSIQSALDKGAAVIVLSHLGRPTEGNYDAACSLAPVAERLQQLLNVPVRFEKNWLDGVAITAGEVVLCENVRFNQGEKANDSALSQKMASLADVFVLDAFATAHRAQASVHGVAQYAKIACAGPLLLQELHALEQGLQQPKRPVVGIVGGAKVSTKLTVLQNLLPQVDHLIVGGGIANTFIAAQGFNVGKSLFEPDLIDTAKQLLQQPNVNIPLPLDVAVSKTFSEDASATIKAVDAVADDDLILDVGPETIARYQQVISEAQTILWNGPLGVFEFPAFAKGTQGLAHSIAQSEAFSIAGGGDTIAAIEATGVAENISYISTGGGAFLQYLEGKPLPAVEMLQQRAKEHYEHQTF